MSLINRTFFEKFKQLSKKLHVNLKAREIIKKKSFFLVFKLYTYFCKIKKLQRIPYFLLTRRFRNLTFILFPWNFKLPEKIPHNLFRGINKTLSRYSSAVAKKKIQRPRQERSVTCIKTGWPCYV